jgi:N-methylhydantoinase B
VPSRAMAPTGGNTTGFLSWMPEGPRGLPMEVDDLAAIGYGATPDQDGMNALMYHSLAGMEVASGEVLETRANVSKRRIELVTDSGGYGRRRGGLGTHTVWQLHSDSLIQVQAQKTETVGGLGLAGGGPAGGSNEVVVEPGTAKEQSLGMAADTELSAGGEIAMNGAGGGGYGNPLEREIEAVESDVFDGYVSVEAAAEHYGVVILTESGRVDQEATRALREASACADVSGGTHEELLELHESDQQLSTERK